MDDYDASDSVFGSDEKAMDKGLGILFIFLIFYMFGFIYLIYSRFMSDIIEDLIYLAEAKGGENLSQISFCILNSMSVLIYCFIANFYSKSDVTVSVVLGTDIYQICFLYSLLLIKIILKPVKKSQDKDAKQEPRYFDAWLILRDMSLYIVSLGVLTLFLYMENVEWWMALIMFTLTVLFFIVVQKNDSIKDKIYRMVGITNEDDSFNADQQLQQRKKAVTIEVLVQNKFINRNADDLKKRIAKNEGLIIMKHGNKEDKRAQLLMKFHAGVYTAMFAIRNKNRYEKELRSKAYAALWKDENDQDDEQNQENEQNNDQNSNINQQQLNEENKMLLGQTQNNYLGDHPQEIQANQLQSQNNNDQPSSQNDYNEDNQDEDDSDDEIQEISMKFPQGGLARLSYIIFFPFHLILYSIKNYHKDPSLMKLFWSFFCNFILLGGTLFLIEWWTYEVALSLNIPISVLALIFISFGLSLPYMVYNIKICKKEKDNVEFFQSYLELGISKIGICLGLPWLFNNLVNLESNVIWKVNEGIKHMASAYTSAIFLLFIFILINGFKADYNLSGVLIFLLLCFLIVSCLVLILDI